MYRREYRATALDLQAISAITAAELAAVISKHPLTRATTVTIGPLGEI
jgi:hypothetical protein